MNDVHGCTRFPLFSAVHVAFWNYMTRAMHLIGKAYLECEAIRQCHPDSFNFAEKTEVVRGDFGAEYVGRLRSGIPHVFIMRSNDALPRMYISRRFRCGL